MINSWGIFSVAFAAVVVQAWASRKNSPNWYLGCIVPLLYGAAVAWMFVGEDLLRSILVILVGTAIPITVLLSAWLRRREEERGEVKDEPRTDP